MLWHVLERHATEKSFLLIHHILPQSSAQVQEWIICIYADLFGHFLSEEIAITKLLFS